MLVSSRNLTPQITEVFDSCRTPDGEELGVKDWYCSAEVDDLFRIRFTAQYFGEEAHGIKRLTTSTGLELQVERCRHLDKSLYEFEVFVFAPPLTIPIKRSRRVFSGKWFRPWTWLNRGWQVEL